MMELELYRKTDSVSRVNDEIKGLNNVAPCTCVKLHIQSGFLLHMLSTYHHGNGFYAEALLQCSCSINTDNR